MLDRFERDRPRLFVLGPRRIDGIVTVYDLNQPAAHQFGFALSLIVEAEVGRAIELAIRNEDDELDTDVDERIRQRLIELPEEEFKGARGRVARWRKKLKSGEQVRLTRELTFHDKIGLIKGLGLAPALARRCRSPYGDSGDVLLACLRDQVKGLRNAVAHDANTLADEWTVWEWMRTSNHLANDLSETTTP